MRPLIAHSSPTDGLPDQPLFDAVDGVEAHSANVARRAGEFAAAFGSERVAEWLGWWHDAGKVAPDVQAYLHGETGAKTGPDHSSAGMLAAADLGVLWPLAFNIAGHHGGLSDQDALRSRIERKRGEARVVEALAAARPLLAGHAAKPEGVPPFVTDEHAAELWLRMLHSALVDADCLDTEAFRDPAAAALRARDGDLAPLWDALSAAQEARIAGASGDVNAARAEVYRACVAAADGPPGVYRLTVPTGGGKTLSALAFALRHALRHGQRRVVVALPYTSIIEQNADVYRALFAGVNPDAVLEHHSAAPPPDEEDGPAEVRARLAAETWDAPVVVTTTVQLFESLFARHNGRLRKLHRIARSVVVLDEVQTLPVRLLDPTLSVLAALARDYGTTVLLCTATPPALATRDGFAGFEAVTEVAPDPAGLFRRLARVEYTVAAEPWTWAQAAAEVAGAAQVLVVLNTKRDALALLDALGGAGSGPGTPDVLHLSTLLCGAHRRSVLADVRERLRDGRPVRLVSTQVVEAGVDLDFPLVMRARGPLDRIIQAAGRCNREGRMARGRVVVFEPAEGHLPPGEYRTATDLLQTVLGETGTPDFDDPDLVERYFRRLYDTLHRDPAGVQDLRRRLLFEQTAAAYRLIEDDAVPVAVPYGDAADVLRRIERAGYATRADFRALQPVLVSLREREHQTAVRDLLCEPVAEGVWRWLGAYDAPAEGGGRGLVWDIPTYSDTCVI